MAEYIERETFIKHLQKDPLFELVEQYGITHVIESYPAADVAPVQRWIPVTERLPEPKFAREWYLVALESGCVKSLAYEKEGRADNLFRPGWHETASPVSHWMPLPEPPKEETE